MVWLSAIMDSMVTLALWVGAFFVIFSLLAKLAPCNPGQPLWRKDVLTDLLYCFIMPLLSRFVRILFIGAGAFLVFYGEKPEAIQHYLLNGFGPVSTMPIWLQAAVMFLVSDIILYWTHRIFHGARLWQFHAIHHSSLHVDWLSTFRFHPVNTWLSFTLVDAAMMLAGFSPAAVAALASFNMIYSAMVHANLNWTFGPFRHVFASPVFHRWHHTTQQEGMDKNFAPTFPLLDIVFGTFYMPEGQKPERFGVNGADIPSGFIGQLAWPFRKKLPPSE